MRNRNISSRASVWSLSSRVYFANTPGGHARYPQYRICNVFVCTYKVTTDHGSHTIHTQT